MEKARTHGQRLARRRGGRRRRDRAYDRSRAQDPRLARAKKIRSSARWQRVRELQLDREPLCQD